VTTLNTVNTAETIGNVGATAGKVWHTLKDSGPMTVAQLRKKLNGSGELVGFALGWLAREDKIALAPDRNTFKVALK